VHLSPALARQVERTTWRLARQVTRLPTSGESPLPSPEAARARAAALLAEGEGPPKGGPADGESAGETRLAAWQVRAVALDPVRAVQLLACLPIDGQLESAEILLGTDLRYWSAVAKLVLELLARQRLVPSLEERTPSAALGRAVGDDARARRGSPTFEARWRPVLDDPRDAERLAKLSAGQPPAARALLQPGPGAPSSAGPSASVRIRP
jgi:hypothetical protein